MRLSTNYPFLALHRIKSMCLTVLFIDILLDNKQRDKKIETNVYFGWRKTLKVYKAHGVKISRKKF